jgi:hypothetical protein
VNAISVVSLVFSVLAVLIVVIGNRMAAADARRAQASRDRVRSIKARRPIVVPRRSSAAEWARVDPVLRAWELGLDTTDGTSRIGDGYSRWSDLPVYRGSVRDPFAGHYAVTDHEETP